MPLALALALFILSLALTIYAAQTFAHNLDSLGELAGLSERLIGLLSALAADAPEIVSALVALIGGRAAVSAGVLVGASALNLASMVGLSALFTGAVLARRAVVLAEALPALLAAVLAAALLSGLLSAPIAALIGAGAIGAYVLAPGRRGARGAHEQAGGRRRPPVRWHGRALRGELLFICAALAGIIAGSTGMVQGALALGERLQISGAVVAVCLLAPLASLPNALTGLRFGLAGRGEALVGEAFHSNAINLAVGAIVPALIVAFGPLPGRMQAALWYLVGASVLCTLLLLPGRGLGRSGGLMLLALYAGFLAVAL